MYLSCSSSDSMKIELKKRGKTVVLLKYFFKKASCPLVMCIRMPGGEHVGSAEGRAEHVCAGNVATRSADRSLLTSLNGGREDKRSYLVLALYLFFQKFALTNNNALESHS